MQPWDVERVRRSVVMTAPGHPAALDRSMALQVIGELQDLQDRHRRIVELLGEMEALFAQLRSVVAGQQSPRPPGP